MANSDYIKNGGGTFASLLALDGPLDHFSTTIPYTRIRLARAGALRPGVVAMIDEEIMRVETVEPTFITVKRGCADTIPAPHAVNVVVWIFDGNALGGDSVERSATEIVAVKVSPFTLGGGGVAPEDIAPVQVEFNWRYFKPYPPGRMKVNNERWTTPAVLDDDTTSMYLSWAHRDRVLQADQLIGHDDDPIGPEPGTTYYMKIVHPVSGQVVRVEKGIRGTEFLYWRGQALHDLGQPSEVFAATWTLTSHREGFDAWQWYSGTVVVHPNETPIYTPVMPFDGRVIEAPYAVNVAYDMAAPAGNYALAMAARPADRMADLYELFANGLSADTGFPAQKHFTPWVTLEYRLPELETIINIRTMSLYDGVDLSAVQVGSMALIDDEIIAIKRVTPTQVFIRRGCADTVPAVHLPGARVWFFQASAAYDKRERADSEAVDYKLYPIPYGPTPHDMAAMPTYAVAFSRRAELPYAPARIVVNNRPWFEEARATVGGGVVFTWARRNRVAQGSGVVAHDDPDQTPEPGQTTRLSFYYETPPAVEGDPPVVHTLRTYDLAGTSFTYSYENAVADGDAAGRALGICGTVVIYCWISALRDGHGSLQGYMVPIRVPSYPC